MPQQCLDDELIEDKLAAQHYTGEQIAQIMPKLKEIDDLRRDKNALILAHYYQILPIQLIADIRGDSLKLAMAAREIRDKQLIVSSTVHFMAEMVKLLNQKIKVVIPDLTASCSIAEGINGEALRAIRKSFPSAAIIGYINTTAESKAEMDSVCTSTNAALVAQSISGSPIILLPDYNLSKNVLIPLAEINPRQTYLAYKEMENGSLVLEDVSKGELHRVRTGRFSLPIRDKGTCEVHERFTRGEVEHWKEQHNIDEVLSHPEVNPDVAAISDMVGGTKNMIDYVGLSPSKRFLVITECDLLAALREAYPDREFITPCYLCQYMKKNTLDNLTNSLRNEVYEIKLDERTAEGARRSLERMFELTQ